MAAHERVVKPTARTLKQWPLYLSCNQIKSTGAAGKAGRDSAGAISGIHRMPIVSKLPPAAPQALERYSVRSTATSDPDAAALPLSRCPSICVVPVEHVCGVTCSSQRGQKQGSRGNTFGQFARACRM